jgi:serine/threonine-protein kinase
MEQLGKYTVIRRLGIGGMAEVFLCRLVGIGGFEKQVVLKRIRADIEADPEFMMMFFDEARVAANLNHPNIIQVFEVDQLSGTPYLAMEYVRGATLSRVLQKLRASKTALDLGHFAYLFAGVCAGLDHAHNARDASGQPLAIVHRDISPQNIIVSFDGTPKIFDFGVAKARGSMNQTGADRVKGKFAYMAPEQLRARPVDAKADVYAVGVCMYEAVTGRRPFSGGTEGELLAARLEGRFTMPSEYLPQIPVELEHLILSAMAPDPSDRPTALELHQALAGFCGAGSEHASNALVLAAWLREMFAEEVVEAYESYPSVNPSLTSLPRSTNLPPTSSAVEARLRKPWRGAVLGAVAVAAVGAVAVVLTGLREEPAGPSARQPVARVESPAASQERELRAVAQAQQELEEKHRRELEQIRQEIQEAKRDDVAPPARPAAAVAAAAAPAAEYTVEERKADRTPERMAPKKKPAPAPAKIAIASKGAGSASMAVGRGSAGSGSGSMQGSNGGYGSGSSGGSGGAAGSGGAGSAYVAAQAPSPAAGSSHAPAAGSASVATQLPTNAPRAAAVAVINPGSLDAMPSFAKLSVDGSLTTTEVSTALSRTADALRSCYRAAAKKANQTPDVSIRVSFEIDEGARASSVRISGDVLGLGACAKETLGGVRTRVAPDVGTVSVSAVIRFKPVR